MSPAIAPKDADIRADFGLALELVGKIPEAIEPLQEVFRLNPNNAETHNNLGLALLASGHCGGAIGEKIPDEKSMLRTSYIVDCDPRPGECTVTVCTSLIQWAGGWSSSKPIDSQILTQQRMVESAAPLCMNLCKNDPRSAHPFDIEQNYRI